MLRERIISAFLGVILLFTVLLSEKTVLIAGVFVVTILIIMELYRAFELTGKKELLMLGILPPIYVFSGIRTETAGVLLFLYILAAFIVFVFRHDSICLYDILVAVFFTLFVTFFMWTIVLTRTYENGRVLIWAVFIGGWLSDTFAFFTGTFLGKHKLLPNISPKKTVEGAIGGLLGCVLGFIVYGIIIFKVFSYEVYFDRLLILGILSSMTAQLGDLSASAIKRERKIKDFGSIMPGHGGALDRFDSILFVAPLVYYYISIFPLIK